MQIFEGRCPFANPAARDVVGTRCLLAKRGKMRRSCEYTVTVIYCFLSKGTVFSSETFAFLTFIDLHL